MANIFNYVSWVKNFDFEQEPFNPVDNVVFSQLSFFPFDAIIPGPEENLRVSLGEMADYVQRWKPIFEYGRENCFTYKNDLVLLKALGSSKRYKDCELCGYVNVVDANREFQFSAISIVTSKNSSYIAYRGTDSTLVGWKENFKMCYIEAVPSQLRAVSYIETMAQIINGTFWLGGHSKGGNLAVYAAANCSKEVQQRITAVYSNDGPGFHKKVIEREGFAAIRDRIQTFVPESSVVGMLLEQVNGYTVIKSSGTGLGQHMLYSWEVTRDNLIYVGKRSSRSLIMDKSLREWIGNLDIAQREKFFEALYDILCASQAKTVLEIRGSRFRAARKMLKSLDNIDDSTRKLVRKTLAMLFSTIRYNTNILLEKWFIFKK